jgi:hypothetical protein
MTHRPVAARAASAAVLAALLLGLVPATALAAEPITIEARTLVGGRFEAEGWAAIAVSLSNTGEPLDGYVTVESEDGVVRRPVDLPAGAQKQVSVYVRPPSFGRTIEVRFEDRSGTDLALAQADIRVLERTTGHVAIVGDGGGNLRPQLLARAASLPEPIPLTAADIPDRPEPLRGIEAIIWAADSGSLTEAQRRSIERWIAAGGQLVVLGGPDWQSRVAAFTDLLPVEAIAAVDDTPVAPLFDWIGADVPGGGATATASFGTLRTSAVQLVGGDGGGALFAAISRGAGRVSWLGIDLATPPFLASAGAPLLWSRLLPDDRLIQQFTGQQPVDDQVAGAMLQALSNLPSLEVPPAELLLAVLVGYILLIGPVSYLVLRRLDRRELAWITAPLLVAVFSAGTYGLGSSMKGSDIIVNEIDIIRSTTGGTAASVSSFAGVFSPTRASYDLTVRGDALFSGLRNIFVDGESTSPFPYATEQGDPSHLRGLAVSVFGLEAVRAETVIAYTPRLVVDWSFVPGGVEGRVTNEGDVPMEDVAVVSQSGGLMVGTLGPDESKDFALSLDNLGGAMASEQVYGFSSGSVTSAAGRRIQARRQVIDALVGYGGGGWREGPRSGSGGIDAGPFVLGWQVDASPMPVEIDGHSVQRYTQAVEVLSGNPQFGPGPVAVEPSQMVTALVSSAGTVGEPEPGWVTIGDGEAVFQVSLPLEATGIVPTEIELIAGSEPSIIFFNQGNMQATLPRGYRISAYDRLAGEWFDVGDLSLRSHFIVERPARVLDHGNRILVRVTGSGIRKEFRQSTVFVGAGVEGVI